MSAVLKPAQTSVKLTRHYPHPREKVFRAWTDAQALKHWFRPSEQHRCQAVELDPRVGGRYRIDVRSPDGEEHSVGGVYREIVAPSRLVFTWSKSGRPDFDSVVTIELREVSGGTELTLTHERLPDAESRARHEQGWTGCLEHLGTLGLR